MKSACFKSALQQGQVSLPCDFYFLARSSSIATAGSTLPSTNRGMRRRQWRCRRFCQQCRTVDCCQSVAAASDGERFAVCDALATISVPLRKFGNSNTPTGRSTKWFSHSSGFQPVPERKLTDIQDLLVSFHIVNRFQGSGAVSENSVATRTSDGTGMLQWSADVLLRQPDQLRTGIYPLVALCRDKGVSDTTTNNQLVAILDRESRTVSLVDTLEPPT